MKTAERKFLDHKGIGSGTNITTGMVEGLLKEYAQQNTLNRDKVMEICRALVKRWSGRLPKRSDDVLEEYRDKLCSLSVPKQLEPEGEAYDKAKIAELYDDWMGTTPITDTEEEGYYTYNWGLQVWKTAFREALKLTPQQPSEDDPDADPMQNY